MKKMAEETVEARGNFEITSQHLQSEETACRKKPERLEHKGGWLRQFG